MKLWTASDQLSNLRVTDEFKNLIAVQSEMIEYANSLAESEKKLFLGIDQLEEIEDEKLLQMVYCNKMTL